VSWSGSNPHDSSGDGSYGYRPDNGFCSPSPRGTSGERAGERGCHTSGCCPLPVPLAAGAGRGDRKSRLRHNTGKNFQVPIRMSLTINSRNLGTFSFRRRRRLSFLRRTPAAGFRWFFLFTRAGFAMLPAQ
jgi:hypothetical protein